MRIVNKRIFIKLFSDTYVQYFIIEKMLNKSKIGFCLIVAYLFSCGDVSAIDTLNHVDANNMKQGHWVYTNKIKKLPNYKENQVIEEGDYADDKKTGKWTYYYNNNKVKQILTYSNNHPDGYAIFYYKNGNKKEEGTWKNNKWIGTYTYYYENGKVRNDWSYNESGQRTGVQKYYYDNGQLMVEGEWLNGKESGTVTEYYLDGSVKSERLFQNGNLDVAQIKKYKPQEKEGKVTVKKVLESPKQELRKEKVVVLKKPVQKKDIAPWSGTGERQFFNKGGQVIREGYFENGYLMNGKMHTYTIGGEKKQTIIYEDGKIIKEIEHKNKEQKNK
ncbi:MAG: hypothetical protein CMD20_01500 [Flavobacteriales bacterium]|nr:hypothetical protein [Flavobacteriales bacterium]